MAGCTGQKENIGESGTKKMAVYTSFYTLYDFTIKIGGDKIDLVNIVPSGTEPHDWEPSPKDIKNLENADVLIYNGMGMEPWVGKVLNSLKNKKLVPVETAKGIEQIKNERTEIDDKAKNSIAEPVFDPHVWLNPINAKKQMEAIRSALSTADPSNKDYYDKNYSEYSTRLDELDKKFKEASLNFKKKEIVVSHQAFGYLCDAYELNQVAIEGLSAESEPTPARMAEIIKYVREHKVKVIFFEELLSPKVAQAIAKATGAVTEMLNPFEGLNDEDIKAGKDYFSVMEANLSTLKKALE